MNKIITIIVLFVALGICFRYWIDTRVYTSERCMHLDTTTAVLHSKTPLGCCCWYVGDSDMCSESWFNCGDINVGETIDWDYTNYSCQHLLDSLNL